MQKLISEINKLRKTKVKNLVDKRIKEFEKLGKSNINKIFSELAFCITTANCSAERCIEIQKKLKNKLLKISVTDLQKKLKKYGYRYHNRACYLVEAREKKEELKKILKNNESIIREWLAKNIKGLGYKEASHFLRNIGFKNIAIVDFHIIDILVKNKIISKPKTMTKKLYLEIEEKLRNIAKKLNLSLAELDLYLWYLETGKILK